MRRDIVFNGTGKLAECLVSPERSVEIEKFVSGLVEEGASLQRIIEALNERGDLTDNEWAATIFSIGYFGGAIGWGE